MPLLTRLTDITAVVACGSLTIDTQAFWVTAGEIIHACTAHFAFILYSQDSALYLLRRTTLMLLYTYTSFVYQGCIAMETQILLLTSRFYTRTCSYIGGSL
jgi:hypothetical protein